MKESIYIKNFGPLRDVRIDDIKPQTVLIGDSASGKSTLMKVIALMRYMCKKINIRSYLASSGADAKILPYYYQPLDSLWYGAPEMITRDSVIEYDVCMPDGDGYSLTCYYGVFDCNHPCIKDADLVFFKEAFVAETRGDIPVWYVRGAAARGDGMGYYFNETFDDFFRVVDQISEQPLDYVDMKMSVVKGQWQKELLVMPNDEHYEAVRLHQASSGIQTSAPLMAIVRYFARDFSFTKAFRRSVLNLLSDDDLTQFRPQVNLQDLKKYIHLYVEEPELSLDPQTQCLFINDLIREAFYRAGNKRPDDGRELGLMFATHSPYILNHLNVLLRASYYEQARQQYPYIEPDEIAAYRMDGGKVYSLMATDNLTEQRVINTIDLSDTMEEIFEAYDGIDK